MKPLVPVVLLLLTASTAFATDAPDMAAYTADFARCQALLQQLSDSTQPPCTGDAQAITECLRQSARLAQQTAQACMRALADVDPAQAAAKAQMGH